MKRETQLVIRLSKHEKTVLAQVALAQDRSMGGTIRHALRLHIPQFTPEPAEAQSERVRLEA